MEKQLEAYLHAHIPISKSMGITVEPSSLQKVILAAPFENNINHKKTVFGGSLHAVATLACWSLLHLNLKDLHDHIQIVITKSHIEYLAPVEGDFKAICHMPEPDKWQYFLKTLQRKGKARIQLSAQIHYNNKLSVDYQAQFAVIQIKQ